ncbi:MAG: (Fe-S)-binding protein [Candidatus Thorarchaeota archaeon]
MKVIEEWSHNCIRCGNCKYAFRHYFDTCPSGHVFRFESYFASGRVALARALNQGILSPDVSLMDPVFLCTTCGSCEVQCLAPHRAHIVEIIEELRHDLVTALGSHPAHARIVESVRTHHNPYGVPHDSYRLRESFGLPDRADVVYFIGCTSRYRETSIRDATVRVLRKSGVRFTVVDEYCCASPLLRTGHRELALGLARHNAHVIQEADARTVVTSCAGCYRALTRDYPRLGVDLGAEVVHSSHLFDDLLEDGRMSVRSHDGVVTYHDPCHLGRHCGVYEPPRNVIRRLGFELVEMQSSRENAWCCGAGGGVKAAYPSFALSTAHERIAQARNTGVDTLVSACPFCKRNLAESSDGSITVIDLAELLDSVTL